MTMWLFRGRKLTLKNNYRTWGKWYKDNSALLKHATKYFVASVKTPKYDVALGKYPFLLHQEWAHTEQRYYTEELMAHVRKHLKDFENFRALRQTYLVPTKVYVRLDGDIEILLSKVITVEKPLYERDRLLQIFKACPPGSYGYYAYRGLGPVKFFVGSFAAAKIDQFFASLAQFLKQPFGESVDDIMTFAETSYWNSRKEHSKDDFVNWVAGQVIGQKGRSNTVWLASKVSEWVEGQRHTSLPGGQELTEKDWNEVASVLKEMTEQIDVDIADGIGKRMGELYDEIVAKKQKTSSMDDLD